MKSILFASKPSNNNQLTVGSKLGRIDSSINNNQHYQHLTNNSTATSTTAATTAESVVESIEKEHYGRLFSNSKKQVIRNRCGVKSDSDKVKRVSSDVSDGKIPPSGDEQRLLIKTLASDNHSELEYLENRPLIGEKQILAESEVHSSGKTAVKFINLRKKNGTTLIFQKKSNAQRHQRANEYQELESYKKRRSLQQWPNNASTNQSEVKNISRHSWYDSDHYPRAIEEEQDVSKQTKQFNERRKIFFIESEIR